MNKVSPKWVVSVLAFSAILLAAGACARNPSPVPTVLSSTQTTAAPPSAAAATPVPTKATDATPTAVTLKAGRLLLATTTSTRDSGLLDFILPDFERRFNVKVDVVAVGSGQAMRLGQDGNAEVLLVHSRAAEDKFMVEGHGVRREDVMYNDYVLVGPSADPAGISGFLDLPRALAMIAEKQAKFVSRGDESGTHAKEKELWHVAGVEPQGSWYISAGQGMGAVLTMADEQLAYTLTDRATYLARKAQGLQMQILVEGDPLLFNPYGVIAVNPAKNAQTQGALVMDFVDWIISPATQEEIGTFGKDKWGQALFFPNSRLYTAAQPK